MSEPAPAWAHGQDMAFLREAAALFKRELGEHCHGAFGLPKENTIAQAMVSQEAIWTRDKCQKGQPIAAMALLGLLGAGSSHEDFAGRKAHPRKGDLIIRAIAGKLSAKRRLLWRILERPNPAWLEGHVENAELCALAEEMGFRLAMVKVAASSDLKGLWLRCSPALAGNRMPPALEPADIPALAILQEEFISPAEQAEILCEAERWAQLQGWADHYSSYNKGRSWSAIALRGFSDDPGFIEKPAEMSKAWKAGHPLALNAICRPTDAARLFPAALAIASRIPGAKQRIRLMRLAPKGGELTRHADITDPEAGTGPGKLCRIHIPLRSSPDCRFMGWGLDGQPLEAHFPERALCYLDTRKPHAARNAGAQERIHLVVDTFASGCLRQMIGKSACI